MCGSGIDIYGLVTILQFSFGGLSNSLHEGKGLYIGTVSPKTEPGMGCCCVVFFMFVLHCFCWVVISWVVVLLVFVVHALGCWV